MNEFKEKQLKKQKHKTLYDCAVNDAWYTVEYKVNGKSFMCPYYSRWKNMLMRCFNDKYQEKFPTYKDCTVCVGWLLFSNFKSWMIKQDWKDKQLDKDLLIQGNKVYSPSTCLFVTNHINSLFLGCKEKDGDCPTGVWFDNDRSKFESKMYMNGKTVHLGRYDSAKEAFLVYKKAKYKYVAEIASKQLEPLKSALLNYEII